MQSLHSMTLLEELQARLLAKVASASKSGPNGTQVSDAISSYPGDPTLSWSNIASDSLTTEPGARRAEGK